MVRTIGDKSICEMCGKPIEYIGPHWRHTTYSPRHPATPEKAQEDVAWQGYSADTIDDEARSLFKAKFGREPEELHRTGGGVNVGPLAGTEVNHD